METRRESNGMALVGHWVLGWYRRVQHLVGRRIHCCHSVEAWGHW